MEEWIASLDNLNYPNLDIILVDTTPDTEEYFERLKKIKLKDETKKVTILRRPWDNKNEFSVQMLARVRDLIRQNFLENKEYTHLFFLDDDIMIPYNGIQRLLSYNKDCVGFYVHVFPKPFRKPCILKSGEIIMGNGLEFFTFKEIDQYKKFVSKLRKDRLTEEEKRLIPFLIKDKWHPQLFKAHGVNIGCLLISRKVLESVPFRTHPTFIFGEDLWFFNEANDKRFEFWCDSDIRPIHKNTTWNDIVAKEPLDKGTPGFYIAMGPDPAEKIEFIKHRKKRK